ncbi:DUF2510 domain-containing protein [Arthrobacter sp. MDT1-65]
MKQGWHQDPHRLDSERWHDGEEWSEHRRPKQTPVVGAPAASAAVPATSGGPLALLWVASISAAIGLFVGVKPVYAGASNCGSAWFPGSCVPGILDSSTTVSVVFILIAGAAIITSFAISGRRP